VNAPDSMEAKRERLFKAMTACLGREPLRRDLDSQPEQVVDDLLKYYVGDGNGIRVG
jgi:hypothetical protein